MNFKRIGPHGFTLLEVMVAVAIIAIAFTSVLKLHTQTISMNMAANFYAKAPLLAQKLISEWETGMTLEETLSIPEDSLAEFPGFTFEMNHTSMASDLLYAENQEEGDSLVYEIVCTILYNQGQFHYTVKTLKWISP